MSRSLIGLVLGIFSCVSVAATSESAQDYKCHITASKENKVVFYRWKIKDASLNIASLPGKQLTALDGKKYFIKEVVECVSLDKEFSSDKSKLLDKMTLR